MKGDEDSKNIYFSIPHIYVIHIFLLHMYSSILPACVSFQALKLLYKFLNIFGC